MPTRIIELPDYTGDLQNGLSYLLIHNDDAPVGQKSQKLPNTALAALQGRSDYSSEEITLTGGINTPIPATTNSFIRYAITEDERLTLPSLPNNSAKEMYLWCFNVVSGITLYDTDGTTEVGEFGGVSSNAGVYCQFLVDEWVVISLAKPGV